MWKCMICETNNSDDSEICLICYTSKDDAKKYYEKLKNFSYLDDYNVKEPKYNSTDKSSSKPKEAPKPVSSPKPPEPVKTSMHSFYDDFDDEWIDSIGVSEKKEKIKIINIRSKTEKIFMIILMIITIIMLTLSCINTSGEYYVLHALTSGFLIIVPIYLTKRGVTIINTNELFAIFLKLIIWFIICVFIGMASRICLTVINLM